MSPILQRNKLPVIDNSVLNIYTYSIIPFNTINIANSIKHGTITIYSKAQGDRPLVSIFLFYAFLRAKVQTYFQTAKLFML